MAEAGIMTPEQNIRMLKIAWEQAEGPAKEAALRAYQEAQDALMVKTKVADADYISKAVDALD